MDEELHDILETFKGGVRACLFEHGIDVELIDDIESEIYDAVIQILEENV